MNDDHKILQPIYLFKIKKINLHLRFDLKKRFAYNLKYDSDEEEEATYN